MRQVKTSPMKLNLVAKLIRGMSVNEALAQVKFCEKKASKFVETTLLDAQRRAEQTLDLDPLNLHVVESFVGKGSYLKRIRYHGRGQFGVMHKYYAHYYLKLREGPAPPKKKRAKTDHKSFVTRKLILAGPRSIPNSL
jgi:large subunit ribosomal protein L22